MHYSQVLAYCLGRPWAIEDGKLASIQAFLSLKAAGEDVDPETVRAMAAAARPTTPRQQGAVAVIPLYGVLTQRGGMTATSEPLTSTATVGQAIRQAMAEPSITAVVLDVDSPGGEVYGTEELATIVAESVASRTKPLVAVANSMAASAAYWVASQAEELILTPGGEVGSIGVRAMHLDLSKALEMEGIKPTMISAGKFKTEGSPYEPLSDEARAAIEQTIRDYYQAFVGAVARGRGVSVSAVRNGFGEGRMVTARRALAEGMVDRVDTLEGTIGRLAGGKYRRPSGRGALAAAEEIVVETVEQADEHEPGVAFVDVERILESKRRRLALRSA